MGTLGHATPMDAVAGAAGALGGLYQEVLEVESAGTGSVSIARTVGPEGFERLVALKRMRSDLELSADAARRFIDEARLSACIRHANVVGIQHIARDSRGWFLVLDYLEGDSLEGLLDRGRRRRTPVPVPVLVRIALDGLAGLHAAHEAADSAGNPLEILHRDVSPSSLMVGRDGVTRLTDFGVAKALGETLGLTRPGHIVGKPLFLAPEYLQRLQLDRRIDIYAMGVTLHVALAGEPWPNACAATLLGRVAAIGIPPLGSRVPLLAPAITRVVEKACDVDPEGRFATAKEMARALAAAGEESTGVASHEEVAACVERLAGADLALRRQLLASGAAPGLRRAPPTAAGVARALVSDPRAFELARTEVSRSASPPRASNRRLPWWAALLILVTAPVVVVVAYVARSSRPEESSNATLPRVESRAEAAPPQRSAHVAPPPVDVSELPDAVGAEPIAAPTPRAPPAAKPRTAPRRAPPPISSTPRRWPSFQGISVTNPHR